MNIVFINRGGENLASYRYRTRMPALHLADSGHTVSINGGDADVAIFSKPVPEDMEIARQCKKEGTTVYADLIDDHFESPRWGETYKEMVSIADKVITATDAMRDSIHERFGRDSVVIPDPFEAEREEPHADGEKVLWFGHQKNIGEVVPYLEKFKELSVVTGNNNKLTGYIPWSTDSLKAELAYNNLVILPSADDRKSANRLINAVMSGCFVLSARSATKNEFREFLWVNDNIMTGYQWAREFRDDLNDLVRGCQDYIIKNYSIDVIGKQWEEIL